MAKEDREQHKVLIPGRWVERIEEIFHVILGIFLLGIAVAALIFSIGRVFETVPFFPTGMIQAINDILFITYLFICFIDLLGTLRSFLFCIFLFFNFTKS